MRKKKLIVKMIHKVWESLDSHLAYVSGEVPFGADFHRKTVLFYAKQIVILAKLLSKMGGKVSQPPPKG